jgi:hypothetical protein
MPTFLGKFRTVAFCAKQTCWVCAILIIQEQLRLRIEGSALVQSVSERNQCVVRRLTGQQSVIGESQWTKLA